MEARSTAPARSCGGPPTARWSDTRSRTAGTFSRCSPGRDAGGGRMIADFLAHLFPRAVRGDDLRLTHTFCLGGLAFTAFLVLGLTGGLLLFFYLLSPAKEFEWILHLESG